jgi:hypothetical protein
MNKIIAWDIFEYRLYGAIGETNHRVLWVDHYRRQDGSTPDLDWMLEKAKVKGGIDGGASTIHVRPLAYCDEYRNDLMNALKGLVKAYEREVNPASSWENTALTKDEFDSVTKEYFHAKEILNRNYNEYK